MLKSMSFGRDLTLSRGLILLFLSLFLTACATVESRPPPRMIKEVPPSALTEETPRPTFTGSVTGDLLLYIEALEKALQQCNDDKFSIKVWAKGN